MRTRELARIFRIETLTKLDAYDENLLNHYETRYAYPCWEPWPPTVESLSTEFGLDPQDVCRRLAQHEASGELPAIRADWPGAPVRDPAKIPQEILFKQSTLQAMRLARNVKTVDKIILALYRIQDTDEPTVEDIASTLPLPLISKRRIREGLRHLRGLGLLDPMRLPQGDGTFKPAL
jgi:hypothetical protein